MKSSALFRSDSTPPPHPPSATQHNKQHASKQVQLALLLWWLYGAVAIGVLRSFFYVSDSQPLKGASVYYRKPVWRLMETESIETLTRTMLQVCCCPISIYWVGIVASSEREGHSGCVRDRVKAR